MDKWIECTVLKRRLARDWRDGSVCNSPCANMKTKQENTVMSM